MDVVEITPTLANVRMAGAVTYVTNQFAMMALDVETTDTASNTLMMLLTTFASVKLDGKENPVKYAYLTGNVHNQTMVFPPASIQMTVSAQQLD